MSDFPWSSLLKPIWPIHRLDVNYIEGLINVMKLWTSQGNEFEMYPYVPNRKKITFQTYFLGSGSMWVFSGVYVQLHPKVFASFSVTLFSLKRYDFSTDFQSATCGVNWCYTPRPLVIGVWGVFFMACTCRSLRMSSCFALSVIYLSMFVDPWAKQWPVQNSFAQANFT